MTGLDLDTIETRANAATEGPWHESRSGKAIFGLLIDDEVARCDRPEDYQFVKHARTDIPALVAEVRKLRAARDRALKRHRPSAGYCVGCWEAGGYEATTVWPCPTVIDLEGETP